MENKGITVKLEGRVIHVTREVYVKAKTKALRDFGYQDLDEAHVAEQLAKILEGERNKLTVIGHFMKDDIVLPAKEEEQGG